MPKVLDLPTRKRPRRITLSVYGAGRRNRKGAFRLFNKGLHAAAEAGLPPALSMIVTNQLYRRSKAALANYSTTTRTNNP